MIQFRQKRKLENLKKLRAGKGGYGLGHDCHCTSVVPCPDFNSYFSFNAGVDESSSLKTGIPSRDDILLIAHELGSSWKMVGRVLNVSDAVIDQIEVDEFKVFDRCYSKCNCVVFVVIMGKHRILRCGQVKVFKGH